MIKIQTKNNYPQLEKIFTVAGLAIIIVGCIANLYGVSASMRFIQDAIDLMYYFRYIILLGGGFAIGYLLTKKSARRTRYNQLFLGVVYATLAMALFWLGDFVRVDLQNIFDNPPYPWGKIIFMGMSVLSIIVTAIVAYFLQYKSNRSNVHPISKAVIIFAFIFYQIHSLASSAYSVITGAATYDPNMPVWLIAASYLTTPLVIAIASYLFLNNVKKWFDRLFFAVLVGAFYLILTLVLWEFRTDASYEATNIFSGIVAALTILFAGVLLWRARRAVK